jgi:CRP/FNR family cyclic AMP-dependent transcriptional regulator
VPTRVRIVPRRHRRKHEEAVPKSQSPLQTIARGLSGPFLKERLVANLSQSVIDGLDGISTRQVYGQRDILFVEGQEAHAVFLLQRGRVKLSTSSPDGKALLLRIAEAGEVIGLPGTLSGQIYVLTAEALEPIEVNVIPREPFIQFLRAHGEAALRVAEIVNDIYHATFRELQYLAHSGSATEKLARFLLEAAVPAGPSNRLLQVKLTLTHEEIAEAIGVARETVSRVFTSFKRNRLIDVRGSVVVISDPEGLEKLADPNSR